MVDAEPADSEARVDLGRPPGRRGDVIKRKRNSGFG